MRTLAEPVDLDATLTITLFLRASKRAQDYGAKLLSGDTTPLSRDEAEEITSADPADQKAVLAFFSDCGLHAASDESRTTRKVYVKGTVSQMNLVFGVKIGTKHDCFGHEYLGYEGQIVIPAALQPIVEAVLGLDARAVAQPRLVVEKKL